MEKGIMAILALIVIFYMAEPLVTALATPNLTDIGGTDLSWVITIVGIVFFVGVAMAVYYTVLSRGK